MRSNNEVNRRFHSVAEGQAGFFTAKQVKNAEFSKNSHTCHVREGHWARESRGIYRLPSSPAKLGRRGPGRAGTGCLSSFYRFGCLCYARAKRAGYASGAGDDGADGFSTAQRRKKSQVSMARPSTGTRTRRRDTVQSGASGCKPYTSKHLQISDGGWRKTIRNPMGYGCGFPRKIRRRYP